jgi:cellulose synthase operon protein C
MAYRFPSVDALLVAVHNGVLPAEVLASPVGFVRAEDGVLWVDAPLPSSVEDLLLRLDVTRGPLPAGRQLATSWVGVIQPTETGVADDAPGEVLFLTPNALELAGEMLRLGCDRQALCFLNDGTALIHTHGPPLWTTLRAVERDVQAFVPAGPPGVWLEIGTDHALKKFLRPPSDQLLVMASDGRIRALPNGPWHDLYALTDIVVSPPTDEVAIAPPRRLEVPLKLARGGVDEKPTLWVLRKQAIEQVDALVGSLPEAVLHRLLFAVAIGQDEPVVILRARTEDTVLELDAEAHAPLARITNLFRPHRFHIEPPLRRDRIRELLAPPPDEIGWLAPGPEGRFTLQRIADAAFQPLADWVDYLADRDAEALDAWRRSTRFEFEAFRNIGVEWAEAPQEAQVQPDEPVQEAPIMAVETERPARKRSARPRTAPAQPVAAPASIPSVEPSELERRLAEVENRFVEMDLPADAPERQELWVDMAQLNTGLARRGDASLCWGRGLWELAPEQEGAMARRWADEEALAAGWSNRDQALTAGPTMETPTPGHVRAVAAALMASASNDEAVENVHAVTVWLDRFDDDLDVRTFWLARYALSKLAGGDTVLLGRGRDRALQRIIMGLSVERDLPTFLRFVHLSGQADSMTAGVLSRQLEELLKAFNTTERQHNIMEADPAWTAAYVHLGIAWGFARLGRAPRARALRQAALDSLDRSDVVHRVLTDLYNARIDQALEGKPPESALPSEVTGALNDLGAMRRYLVDRLRQNSRILETQERLNPMYGYLAAAQFGEQDPRGSEFQELRSTSDVGRIAEVITEILNTATKAEPAERARLFDGALDFFPSCAAGVAAPWLEQVADQVSDMQPMDRIRVLEECLMVAGLFGRRDLANDLMDNITSSFTAVEPGRVGECVAGLNRMVRNMRRFGLQRHLRGLLDALDGLIKGRTTDALVARLTLAAGRAAVGDVADARPKLEKGFDALAEGLLIVDRLRVTRAMADALGHTPIEEATAGLARLRTQLPRVTDGQSTNSHFCLSVVSFMESLVLGYVSEDLVLGDQGRRWLDEDEYLVRRRIHRDART